MLVRTLILYAVMLTGAIAFHDNTFAVFELKEELQMRFMNLWELFLQLEYVNPDQRAIVYAEIEHLKQEISRIIDQLILLDKEEH